MKRALLSVCLMIAICASSPAFAAKDRYLEVQTLSAPGGIQAWLVEDTSLPLVTMKFSFLGGLAQDPEDKPGLAKLVSVLLDEGAGDLRSQDFQAQLSNHAIGLSFSPGRDAFHGSLRTTSTHRDLAFSLLKMALTQPRFDPDAITRMKNALNAELQVNLGDPSWLSARTFNGIVFEGHYYAQPGGGTRAGLAAVTRRDLQDFVRTQFAQDLLRVVIVGDMTREQAEAMLADVFGGLTATGNSASLTRATLANTGKTVLLPLDTPQTYIAIAQPGVARTDADWYTAQVMSFILGGGSFDSRLMREVREKRGLTYGVYTSLLTQTQGEALQTTLSTSNDNAAEALKIIHTEFARLAQDGVSADELKDAKSYLIGSMPLQLTTTSDIADALMSLQIYGLDPSELDQRADRIRSVTAADVQKLAARLLDPQQMTTILVGQPAGINVDLLLDRAPGLGPDQP